MVSETRWKLQLLQSFALKANYAKLIFDKSLGLSLWLGDLLVLN
jgi:hypothetical protein